jgi:hypothetical protein
MINTHEKYHFKAYYQLLYRKLTNNTYSMKFVSDYSPYQLLMAINSRLVILNCITFTEEEINSICEIMQEN